MPDWSPTRNSERRPGNWGWGVHGQWRKTGHWCSQGSCFGGSCSVYWPSSYLGTCLQGTVYAMKLCKVWTQESFPNWSMIVWVSVLLNRTAVDSNWRFDNLCKGKSETFWQRRKAFFTSVLLCRTLTNVVRYWQSSPDTVASSRLEIKTNSIFLFL